MESPAAPMTPAPPFLQAVSRGSEHKLWQEGHLVCERCWAASLGLGSSKWLYEWTWASGFDSQCLSVPPLTPQTTTASTFTGLCWKQQMIYAK